jgi:16S rRNA G966 N2-methylase RsmD
MKGQLSRSFEGLPEEIPWQALETPAGKGSKAYNAHSYHTKLSLDICRILVNHFTNQDAVVLDPFAGSGMVGIACLLEKRNPILVDISPYAVHIAKGLTTYIDPEMLLMAAKEVVHKTLEHSHDLLSTCSRESKEQVPLSYVIWSERISCVKCGRELVLWDVALEPNGKIATTFRCPFCGALLDKRKLARKGSIPVEVVYRDPQIKCQSRHRPTEEDIDRCFRPSMADRLGQPWQPSNPMMNVEPGRSWGEQWRRGYHYNVTHVRDFFSTRNWILLSYLWAAIEETENPEVRASLRLAFTGTLVNTSRMVRYTQSRGGRSNTPGTLYFPMVWLEQNPIMVFKRRVKRIEAYLKSLSDSLSNKATVQVGSATQLDFLSDESVDFVLTDPPFGENIQYAELNFIAEAWLKSFTDTALEAVVNPKRGQDRDHYVALMHKSFTEVFRVLKKGGYAAVFFNNTDTRLWMSLRNLMIRTGFRIVKVIPACKGHQSWNQLRYRETVTAWDPIIFLWKPLHEQHGEEVALADISSDVTALARGFLRGLIELEPRQKETELPLQQFYSQYASAWFEGNIPGEILNISAFTSEAKKIYNELKQRPARARTYDSVGESSKAFIEALKSISGERDKDIDALTISKLYEEWNEKVHGGRLARRRRAEGSKRRKGGAFYTPPSVVALTVGKTLDSWFCKKFEKIKSSLSSGKTGDAIEAIKEITEITILDPAVGTGLFLLGARQYLREIVPTMLQSVLTANIEATDSLDRTGILAPDATTIGSRWDEWVVKNALWGVDIDIGALHVAKEVICDGFSCELKPNLLQADSLSMELAPERKLPSVHNENTISWYNWPKTQGKANSFWNIIIGNPPWGTALPDKGNIDYSTCYDESALAFLLLSKKLADTDGRIGFVLPSSWLQASSWKTWRQENIRKLGPEAFLILPESTFPDATFTAPPMISIFYPSNSLSFFTCEFTDLSRVSLIVAHKGQLLDDWKTRIDQIKISRIHQLSYSCWSQIPGFRIPVANEWWIKRFFHVPLTEKTAFHTDLIPARNVVARVVRGVKTGTSKEFIAEFDPATHHNPLCYGRDTRSLGTRSSEPIWVWLAKGGTAINDGRPVHFLQPHTHVIRWDKEAISIYRARNGLRNIEYYGKLGIGFPSTGRHSPLFRKVEGMIFDADYPVLITRSEKEIFYLLAILNSPCILFAAKHLFNHSVHFKTGDLLDLPIPNVYGASRDRLSAMSERIIRAIGHGDTEEEMRCFHEIHEIVCDMLDIPVEEKAQCETWYVSRFPGMGEAFENSCQSAAREHQVEVGDAIGS